MRLASLVTAFAFASTAALAQQPFTLQQVLSAPYALDLTAAPVGNRFAWIENAEGRRNIWIASPTEPARQLTHYTEDDAQDINSLAWSPDATSIAYTYGAEDGADGHPANPAHLQRNTANVVLVQPLAPNAPAINLGEGHNPLFTPDGQHLLFLRNGQIWIADLTAIPSVLPSCTPPQTCHPERSLAVSPRGAVEGPATPLAPAPLPAPSSHQLVFDRGHATSLTLSPDGNLLAFISHRPTTDGPAHSFLALFNLTTGELTFPAPSTGEDSAPTFSPNGKQLAWLRSPYTRQPEYTPHLTSPNPWSIQLLDIATNTTRTVYSPEANKPGSVLPHIEDGDPKLLWSAAYEITDPTRPTTNVSSRPERSAAERPAGPFSLIFYSEADGWNHLYAIDPTASSAPFLLTPGEGEVEDAALSADGKKLLWTSNIAEAMRAYAGLSDCMGTTLSLQAADIERRHLSSVNFTQLPLPTSLMSRSGSAKNHLKEEFEKSLEADFLRKTDGQGIEMHPTFLADGSLVSLASDAFAPMHPAYIAKDGTITNVKLSGLPKDYPAKSLVFSEEVTFTSADSARIALHGQIFFPGNTKADGKDPMPWCDGHMNRQATKDVARRPAIIFVHGGPNRQMLLGYPGMDYYSNAYAMNQYLTSLGFIVLSVNYRGGVGYGLNFREAAHYGPDGASEYNDVLAAQKYLASRPDVDPARIGIWGGSYGGYLTALALARNSNLFAAGVDFHGIHEWSLEGNPDRWMPDPTHATAAQRDAAAALAHASSPMADIDKWQSPVLLIHGDNDPEVNFAQTPVLADALRARHVPVEELIFPDEVHGFLLHKDWLAAYTASAAFFVRTLKP